MKKCVWFIMMALCPMLLPAQSETVNDYAVSWDSPSENSSGSMPIGNGEVGANVWMEKNGNLVFLLSRTDAWAENSSLYKLGKVRVSLFPLVFNEQTRFTQRLNLKEGVIDFEIYDGKDRVKLSFLVDSEHPVAYLSGSSTRPLQVMVTPEIWRTQVRVLPEAERHFSLQKCPFQEWCMEYPDQVAGDNRHLTVYHRNERSIYPFTLKHQGIQLPDSVMSDPFLGRTMGFSLAASGFVRATPTMLVSENPVTDFSLQVVAHVAQTPTAAEWERQVAQIHERAVGFAEARKRTAAWWENYWDRSYIVVNTPDGDTGRRITRSYVLQKWMTACAGRGNYPIKFNGSIFTVDPVYTNGSLPYSPDYRLWGPDYWWQNTRLIYHAMLKSGDFDMMRVLFRHYLHVLPMLKANARTLWKAEGAVNPETATIFGATVNHDYGWEPHGSRKEVIDNPYVRYYWSSGLEIVALMYDFYHYTGDEDFARTTLVPFAQEIIRFYDDFFPRDAQGRLRITPTHSLETYWENVVNDLPNVAGLHYVLDCLLSLPAGYAAEEQRAAWLSLQRALPPLPQENRNGVKVYAPAETYGKERTNSENPELYAVFPFPLCHIASPDLQMGVDTYRQRLVKATSGWTQDGQQAARLGLTEEARQNLLAKIGNSHRGHRFPVIWGPNYDWTPDQDHGSNLLLTLQEMVMQAYGKKVYLLPAFPKDWDVTFRLWTPGKNCVTGSYVKGKWVEKPRLEHSSDMKIKRCQ